MGRAQQYREFVDGLAQAESYRRHALLIATVRSILQSTALSLFDIAAHSCSDDVRERELAEFASASWLDTDGSLVYVTFELLNLVRNEGRRQAWKTCCELLNLRDDRARCNEWVTHRNDVAHGVPSASLVSGQLEWLTQLAYDLIYRTAPVMPRRQEGGNQWITGERHLPLLSLPVDAPDEPIVIRKFSRVSSGWRFELLKLQGGDVKPLWLSVDPQSPMATLASRNRYVFVEEEYHGSRVKARLPDRLTNTFQGREEELDTLREWWSEPSKNVLLVHGQGGYGKTTLVIEFLHQILEGELPKPRVMCFCTAKRTRFNGERVMEVNPDASSLDHVAQQLLAAVGREQAPHGKTGIPLWTSVMDRFRKHDFVLADILLVVDNAETLGDGFDRASICRTIDHVARSGVRLVVTSRYNENFQSLTRVSLDGLGEHSAIALAKQLARTHVPPVQAVATAEPALRRALNRLQHVPIYIEALVTKLHDNPGLGVEDCAATLAQHGDAGLVNFLYDHAWGNASIQGQDVLLCLKVVGACSREVLGAFCSETGTLLKFIEEHVFAHPWVKEYRYPGGTKDVALQDWAAQFLEARLADDAENAARVQAIVERTLAKVHVEHGFIPSATEAAQRAFEAIDRGDYDDGFNEATAAINHEATELRQRLALFFAEKLSIHRPDLVKKWKGHLESTADGSLTLARCSARGRGRSLEAGEGWLEKARSYGADRDQVRLVQLELLASFILDEPDFTGKEEEWIDATRNAWNTRANELIGELDKALQGRDKVEQRRRFDDIVGRLRALTGAQAAE